MQERNCSACGRGALSLHVLSARESLRERVLYRSIRGMCHHREFEIRVPHRFSRFELRVCPERDGPWKQMTLSNALNITKTKMNKHRKIIASALQLLQRHTWCHRPVSTIRNSISVEQMNMQTILHTFLLNCVTKNMVGVGFCQENKCIRIRTVHTKNGKYSNEYATECEFEHVQSNMKYEKGETLGC